MIAIVADDNMAAVIEAAKYRRRGIAVFTQLSGNKKRQLKRAHDICQEVIDLDRPAAPRRTPSGTGALYLSLFNSFGDTAAG